MSEGIWLAGVTVAATLAVIFLVLYIREAYLHHQCQQGQVVAVVPGYGVGRQPGNYDDFTLNRYVIEPRDIVGDPATGKVTDTVNVISGVHVSQVLYRMEQADGTGTGDVLYVDYQRNRLYVLAAGGNISGAVLSPVVASAKETDGAQLEYEAVLGFANPESDVEDQVYVKWLPSQDTETGTFIVNADEATIKQQFKARLLNITHVGELTQQTI